MAVPFTSPIAAKTFMLGGKSFTTLVSQASGQRFTYKIELADKKQPEDMDCFFVSVLNGPDNWNNYKYIGVIRNNEYRWTAKSKIQEDAPSVKAFKFCFGHLSRNTIVGFEVWHEGKCGRCGRKLTVPESIASGFGPECINLMSVMTVTGSAAPQKKLHFPAKSYPANRAVKMDGRAAAAAVYGPPQVPQTEHSVEMEIKRRIELFKATEPEDYYQGDMLTEDEAFKVAYNRIKLELKGGK